MEHYFELPVIHGEKERSFKGRLVTFGYVYKFFIVVDGQELVFEKDDEQQFRVISEEENGQSVNPMLMQAIITSLNSL